MNSNRQMAEFYNALAEGLNLQFKIAGSTALWKKVIPDENFGDLSHVVMYRIKPEPEVIYVNKTSTGISYFHKIKENAEFAGEKEPGSYEYIAKKFIEVIE